MFVACWSAKGGSGTTVVSVVLASILARSSPSGALLVDLGGDAPAVLGVAEPDGPGVREWLAAGASVPNDALARLEVEGPGGVRLLPLGAAAAAVTGDREWPPVTAGRAEVLAAVLAAESRPVVVDCGCGPTGVGLTLAAAASISLLVLRPCYLSLRRAMAAPLTPSGVVLVDEPGRALGRSDVENVLGVPVKAVVALDPSIARAVDAGIFPGRLPRSFERALRHAA